MNTYLSFIGITVVLPVILAVTAAVVITVIVVIIILVIFNLRKKPKVSLSLDQEPDQWNI